MCGISILMFFVRIDARPGYLEKIRMLPSCSDYEMILGVKHNGKEKENPHYHLVIKTQVKLQAFRVRLRKIFDSAKGNGNMSIKTWDGDIRAISYMFHEDEFADIIVRHNCEDQTITQAKELCKQILVSVQQSKEKASWRLEDDAYGIICARTDAHTLDEGEIAKTIILRALRTGRYVPQTWLLRAMTERIYYRLREGDEDAEEQVALRLARRIYPQYY